MRNLTRINTILCVLLLLNTTCLSQVSPRDLLRRTLERCDTAAPGVVWQLHGTLQSIYPLPNMGKLVFTEDGSSFHYEVRIGGITSAAAYDSSGKRGWRNLHGLTLPIDWDDARQVERLSMWRLLHLMRRAANGELNLVDRGTTTLPDKREAQWLQIVLRGNAPWDVYVSEEGDLLAWGFYGVDSLRRELTRFVVIPRTLSETNNNGVPVELAMYQDDRHASTIRWDKVEAVQRATLQAKTRPPQAVPAPAGLPVTLPLRFAQRIMMLPVTLNEQRNRFLMLDTGAAITVIDSQTANALRLPRGPSINLLGASGKGEAYLSRLRRLQIGNVTLKDVQVAVLDLGILRLVGGGEFAGILGFNVLNRFRITVDYHDKKVTFDRSGGPLPSGKALRVQFAGAVPQLHIEVDGLGRLPALLDTGAAVTIVPARKAKEWNPARSATLGMALGVGGLGGQTRAARTEEIRLAGERMQNVIVLFAEPPSKDAPVQILSEAGFGLLGNNVLRNFRLTIDYPLRMVVLRRMSQPASIGDINTAGIVLELGREPATVLGTIPLSSASTAGIQRGDIVLEVNGKTTEGVATATLQQWLGGREGSRVRVKLRRNDRVWEEELEILPML